MNRLPLTLPAGLRIEIVDNTDLTLPVGTKATLAFDSNESNPICSIDGQEFNSCLPLAQCKIITDNFNNL